MQISVVIATKDRPDHVRRCLESLSRCDPAADEIIVVDQSAGGATRAVVDEVPAAGARYVHRAQPGLSGARNEGTREAAGDYVAFLDDDGEVPPQWVGEIRGELERRARPEALYGAVLAPEYITDRKAVVVSEFRVDQAREWAGRVHPNRLGYGGHTVADAGVIERVGGFDERLGAGAPLKGAEDMDFNYRLLKAGGRAVTTPSVWMIHHQWRPAGDTPALLYGYNLGHSAFCAKHLRRGDRYAALLFVLQVRDDLKMFASAARRRSLLRLRVALRRTAGTWTGLWRGWQEFK